MSSLKITPDGDIRQHSSAVAGDDIAAIFAPGGVLAQALPSFEPRPGQQQLAETIIKAIDEETHLVAEGATGVGKSLAYLIPAILSRAKVIVATETTLLQDQLALKDLPFLKHTLPVPFTFTTIKGRSRYVCELEFQRFALDVQQQTALFELPENIAIFDLVERWVRWEREHEGVGELDASGIAIPPAIAQHITTDARHCLGRECPMVKQCFAERAKARAKEADVVIANHHLVLLDAVLREQSDGSVTLLPERDVLILDEAHHLEETATSVFGTEITGARWRWLLTQFSRLRKAMPDTVEELLAMADERNPVELDTLLDEVYQALHEALTQADTLFTEWLEAIGDRRSMPIPDNAVRLLSSTQASVMSLRQLIAGAKQAKIEAETLLSWRRVLQAAEHLMGDLQQAVIGPGDANTAQFLEKIEGRFPLVTLRVIPIEVDDLLRAAVWDRSPTVIAVSATLKTGGSFDYWMGRAGAPIHTTTVTIPSPFNFRDHAKLFLSRPPEAFIPVPPNHKEYRRYTDAMADTMIGLLNASHGRALVLCTSYRAMQEWAQRVGPSIPYRTLVQGEYPRQVLLEMFRDDIDSVLFATRSFWQGIDVSGESLSLLIIDRLPFAMPDDPVFKARAEILDREQPGQSFSMLSLPRMVLDIRQGVGRLIRRASDTGVIALLDGRISVKGYGPYVLRSLPAMPRIHSVQAVAHFFAERGSR
jgi:ATP-dependent DNA helicase DinG